MAVYTGYNFIRASALLEFQESFRKRFRDEIGPCELSIVSFFRLVARCEPLPHKCCVIIGLERLLANTDKPVELEEYLHRLLLEGANYLLNRGYFLYFRLENSTTFSPGPTLELRTGDGEYLRLAPIFGRLIPITPDHYRGNFNISS